MILFPPPFYFVFDISNLLSYIQNNFSYELARPIMGTIFLVYVTIVPDYTLCNYATVTGTIVPKLYSNACDYVFGAIQTSTSVLLLLLASERSERDTLRFVQLRIADIYIMFSTCKKFVLITRKEGGA